jgi:hypothetical protein
MLSAEALNLIKKQAESETKPKSKIIYIEIGIGFNYGSVMVGSTGNKEAIKELNKELGWTFRNLSTSDATMMYCTSQELKNAATAISIAEIIKKDLKGKGFEVESRQKTYK